MTNFEKAILKIQTPHSNEQVKVASGFLVEIEVDAPETLKGLLTSSDLLPNFEGFTLSQTVLTSEFVGNVVMNGMQFTKPQGRHMTSPPNELDFTFLEISEPSYNILLVSGCKFLKHHAIKGNDIYSVGLSNKKLYVKEGNCYILPCNRVVHSVATNNCSGGSPMTDWLPCSFVAMQVVGSVQATTQTSSGDLCSALN